MSDTILEVEDLTVSFHLKRGILTAVNGTTFSIKRGETFGLVGESGSGKSTGGLFTAGSPKHGPPKARVNQFN